MILDGKELNVTPASFFEAMELKGVIAKALKRNGLKIDLSSVDIDFKDFDLENINIDGIDNFKVGDIGWIFEHILTLTTDKSIRDCLFKCAKRALFDKQKVDPDFFEEVDNRKYYYPIMMEVMKINILPFFGIASSLFSKLQDLTEKFLKSKSPPQN